MAELPDKNVEAVVKQMRDRAEFGFTKYQTTTERADIDLLGWLQHLQEELMDACVYVERLKKEVASSREHDINRGWEIENLRHELDARRQPDW